MPGIRRQGRSAALQWLYQNEINPIMGPDETERFWQGLEASAKVRAFGQALIQATLEHKDALDAQLEGLLKNWKVSRLSVLVRYLLRMGLAEIQYMPETPAVVVIDEAVALAGQFVDEEAARLVNGVLDQARKTLQG